MRRNCFCENLNKCAIKFANFVYLKTTFTRFDVVWAYQGDGAAVRKHKTDPSKIYAISWFKNYETPRNYQTTTNCKTRVNRIKERKNK